MKHATRIARTISATRRREARALPNGSHRQLAPYSTVAPPTIVDFEPGTTAPRARILAALAECFETAGVVFYYVANREEGLRVRLRMGK